MMNGSISLDTIALHLSYHREVQDLMDNGYSFLFNSEYNGVLVTCLRHCRNGRKLMLSINKDGWYIKENGKIIKHVTAAR